MGKKRNFCCFCPDSPETARPPQTNGMWGSRRCYSYLKGMRVKFCIAEWYQPTLHFIEGEIVNIVYSTIWLTV